MINLTLPTGAIYMGDALALMRALPDCCVDLIFTDPPYKTITGGTEHSKRNGRFKMFSNASPSNDGKIFKHNDIAIADYLPELFRLLKPGCHCYVMINNLNLRELLNCGASVGFHFHNLLRWDKPNNSPNRWYMKDCEYIVFFGKKPAKTINHPGSKQGFAARFAKDHTKTHPTEKPVELIRHYIENSSAPGDLVFDPFAGTGSTALAAVASGRRWLTCELDPEYYLKAALRLASGG